MIPMPQVCFFSGAPGPGELILIFLVVLLLFGPRKLPGFARSLGNLMQQLRRASNDFRDQLMSVEEDMKEGVRAALEDQSGDECDEDDVYGGDLDDAIEDVDGVEVVTDDNDEDKEDRPLAG
jgi:sec-independent protein translocase protein TatA